MRQKGERRESGQTLESPDTWGKTVKNNVFCHKNEIETIRGKNKKIWKRGLQIGGIVVKLFTLSKYHPPGEGTR